MSTSLSCTDIIYAFSKDNKPAASVKPGTTISIDTYDCFQNQITSSETEITSINWDQINPATGPIFVETAQPGDILKVKIEHIELANQGVMTVGPDLGVMGHRLEKFEAKMIPISGNRAIFNEKIEIPLNPMIGVIGVAPEGAQVSCGTPGAHGGNMDTKLITTGATIYVPVFTEGALFALGDMHAAMGDGEVGVSGIEVSGTATVTLDVIKGRSLNHPVLINEEGLAVLVSAKTLDEAVKTSVEEMISLILPHTDLSINELTMLFSALGQTQISQVVDPLVTVRFFVPAYFLKAYSIALF
ncbi:acetamidase/formamidase family protein [Peribacillus deserti]|uniref:Acetamidase n=1 Tax=Peribacillus deserti TaxID=673318 RepID=A0A2N5M4X8_9BACI|nr:acetamidase/formamidase family protein [Peribacillus deserti]PLT29418.1 acetamidase [Peribacillus deserti]